MNQAIFDKQIERIESNFGRNYNDKQKLFLWHELSHMKDPDFIDTVSKIIDEATFKTLPQKSDFAKFSNNKAISSHYIEKTYKPLHAVWENVNGAAYECICDCKQVWQHKYLFWERLENGKTIDHALKWDKREEMRKGEMRND